MREKISWAVLTLAVCGASILYLFLIAAAASALASLVL